MNVDYLGSDMLRAEQVLWMAQYIITQELCMVSFFRGED
jgi:hypothetical protein